MANQIIIDQKKNKVDEIKQLISEAEATIWFDNNGLSVAAMTELRRTLRESNSGLKIYKNTLTKRALNDLNLDLGELEGPKVFVYGADVIAPIKAVSEFAKKHPIEIKMGIVEGKVADLDTINKLASIPSRDTLLTQIAAGLMATAKDFALCIDLHIKNLEN